MPNVVRFTLDVARNLWVDNVGYFRNGVLDIDANRVDLVARARYLLQPYRATELGIVDSMTPPPSLPAVPDVETLPDPYPQYLLPAEVIAVVNAAIAAGTIKVVQTKDLALTPEPPASPATGTVWIDTTPNV